MLSALSAAGFGTLLCSTPLELSQAATASAPLTRAVPAQQPHRGDVRRSRLGRPGAALTCHGVGQYSFLGAAGDNTADGEFSAVLGGYGNEACALESGIGGGLFNVAESSAVGAFVGGGYANLSLGSRSFIGAGTAVSATGAGSVVGGGGTTYATAQGGLPNARGTIASGEDSFVGAGDLNAVSGRGSFIGAGGSSSAVSGQIVTSNNVSGVDSFIGAGDDNAVTGSLSFIGGGENSFVNGSGSFIGAGGYLVSKTTGDPNFITGNDSFVGAGDFNSITTNDAFIGGGDGNEIRTPGLSAAVVGGDGNFASGAYGAIAGGYHNSATATAAAVGGGFGSSASGRYATIPGGYLNAAGGIGSFAAGTQAKARHNGAFVWSDNAGSAAVQSTAAYQFVARASGGYYLYSNAGETSGVKLNPGSGAWSNLSDRTMKTDIAPLDDAAVLAKVAALPLSVWSYRSERGVRHVGPMAQDFYAAFGVGEDDRHITSIDEDGVALAAIKALHAENRRLRERLTLAAARFEAQRARDDARFRALERNVAALAVQTHHPLGVPPVRPTSSR